jgi:hypothetical protein
MQVRNLRQFGVILLLLLSCAAPLMACVTPEAQMTAAEHACCRIMHNQCAQMGMPASEDCCAKATPAAFENAIRSNPDRFKPVTALVLWVASFHVLAQDNVSQTWIQSPENWPPKSPPVAITVLRI